VEIEEAPNEPPPALPPLTPLERRSFDYSGLDAAMAFADAAMQNARRVLREINQPARGVAAEPSADALAASD
jgi:hypothetical protein